MKLWVNCSGTAMLYAAAMFLIFPLNWILACFFAALFHELCHYLAIQLAGKTVFGISITHRGAMMETEELTAWQELSCALAGPAGSILLFLCYPWIPRISLCAGVQGAFNLLPVYPLDGGRAFRVLVRICFPECIAARICRFMEIIMVLLIFMGGFYCFLWLKLGISPVVFAAMILFRALDGKIPCKQQNLRVQ